MANRDVGVSICGVVVGVLLGAGSVMYAQDMLLNASSTDVAYRGMQVENADELKARDVRAKVLGQERDARENAARVKKPKASAGTHTAAPVDQSACGVAKAAAARFNQAINVIPNEQTDRNQEFRSKLGGETKSIVEDFCGSPKEEGSTEETSEDHSAAPEAPTDNNCEQYGEGSVREAKCLGNQNEGKPYIGY